MILIFVKGPWTVRSNKDQPAHLEEARILLFILHKVMITESQVSSFFSPKVLIFFLISPWNMCCAWLQIRHFFVVVFFFFQPKSTDIFGRFFFFFFFFFFKSVL